jgi:signal recognition particle subunit SRP54
MAFEGLSSKLQNIFKKLSGRGKLNEKDVKDAMREVKLALLEADVSFTVVKDFIKNVTDRAVGQEVMESLTPAQQVIKIVNEELTSLMGGAGEKIEFGSESPSVILLAGLQGAGKTTMAGKLAQYIKKYNGKSLSSRRAIFTVQRR